MIIPFQRLSAVALQALLEEFITREGTDYGEVELNLSEKVENLHRELLNGEVFVVFDPGLESVTLMSRAQARLQGLLDAEAGGEADGVDSF